MRSAHKQSPAGSRQTGGAPQQTVTAALTYQKAYEAAQTRTSTTELHR